MSSRESDVSGMAMFSDLDDRAVRQLTIIKRLIIVLLVYLAGTLVYGWLFSPDPAVQALRERAELLAGLPEPSDHVTRPAQDERKCGWFGCGPNPPTDEERAGSDGIYRVLYEAEDYDLVDAEELVRDRVAALGYQLICTSPSGIDWFDGGRDRNLVRLSGSEGGSMFFDVVTTTRGPREFGSSDYKQIRMVCN